MNYKKYSTDHMIYIIIAMVSDTSLVVKITLFVIVASVKIK